MPGLLSLRRRGGLGVGLSRDLGLRGWGLEGVTPPPTFPPRWCQGERHIPPLPPTLVSGVCVCVTCTLLLPSTLVLGG